MLANAWWAWMHAEALMQLILCQAGCMLACKGASDHLLRRTLMRLVSDRKPALP